MRPLVVDNFAGGGGASLGIEQALGIVDVAINHDAEAIAMHQANHPRTYHYLQDITQVDPREVARGRDVRLAWFSPDCKHFSKAKGGRPVDKRIRDLAWVVIRWAKWVQPDVIMLENVEEFVTWCPLGPDGRPDAARKGNTFQLWVRHLKHWGYVVEWGELRACDYGAPTSRNRLFVIARRDGRPIVWPAPTHGPGLQPYRTAAEIMEWWRNVQSIFGREKVLAPKTQARIARGTMRFVVEAEDPFYVPMPTGPTQNSAQLVAAFLAQHNGGMVGHDLREPLSTVTQKGSQQQLVVARCEPLLMAHAELLQTRAFLLSYYGSDQNGDLKRPLPTATTRDRFALVTAHGKYEIADIGMRMLAPRELFNAQGFPEHYIIDPILNGRHLTKTAQVRCCGNSVCPPVARVLVQANVDLSDRRVWSMAC